MTANYLDGLFGGGPAAALQTNTAGVTVDLTQAPPPDADGLVLATTDGGASAQWVIPSGGDVGDAGPATELATADDVTVDVSLSHAPSIGDVLTCTTAEGAPRAEWVAPKAERSAFVSPPASPNAFDDEFSDGDPDLAARGWRVGVEPGFAALTRVGDVVPLLGLKSPLSLVVGPLEYRSTIVNGRLLFQPGANCWIYKSGQSIPTAADGGGFLSARVGLAARNYGGSGANQSHMSVRAAFDAGAGVPDLTNQVLASYDNDNGGVTRCNWITFTAGAFNGSSRNYSQMLPPDILCLAVHGASSAWKPIFIDATSGGALDMGAPVVPSVTASSVSIFGMSIGSAFSVGGPGFYVIDFMRWRPSADIFDVNNWII